MDTKLVRKSERNDKVTAINYNKLQILKIHIRKNNKMY